MGNVDLQLIKDLERRVLTSARRNFPVGKYFEGLGVSSSLGSGRMFVVCRCVCLFAVVRALSLVVMMPFS